MSVEMAYLYSAFVILVFQADLRSSAAWQVTTFGRVSSELPEQFLPLF